MSENICDSLLNRMLDKAPAGMDIRPGSVLYDCLWPVAFELASAYTLLAETVENSYASTAVGEDLTRRAEEAGIFRRKAETAVLQGVVLRAAGYPVVPVGTRFVLAETELRYTVVQAGENGVCLFSCDTSGTAGSRTLGRLVPVTPLAGLIAAELTAIVSYGSDEESDASLRARYAARMQASPDGGNAEQYRLWAEGIPGVGRARVFPLAFGPGTVEILVLGEDQTPASDAVCADVQENIDPGSAGVGDGLAPIGAKVTVCPAEGVTLTVRVSCVRAAGITMETVTAAVERTVSDYFAELAFTRNAVSYFELAHRLSGLNEITALKEVQLNGGTSDITVSERQVAVVGSVTVEEAV